MGASESKPGDGARKKIALHVLRVAENSPAAHAGIEPFFDFLMGISGFALTEDVDAFTEQIERSEGQEILLQVWSSKRQELRDVELVPSRSWSMQPRKGQIAHDDAEPSLLGLSMRLCNPEGALEQVWHVLEIMEGSPAESAGLVPYGDYIIGYAGGVLRGEGDFYELVENHDERPLRLFVYNSDFDITREVVLVPNKSWGNGDGLLGCGIGYGLLHRIPRPQERPPRPLNGHTYSQTHQRAETYPDEEEQHSHGILSSTGVQVLPSSSQPSTPSRSVIPDRRALSPSKRVLSPGVSLPLPPKSPSSSTSDTRRSSVIIPIQEQSEDDTV
ncbi:uncharacterized protein L969DRAFT_86922 [Mixia osmundae IAM 14324]|uniref:PDZ GRASP-type domain-containing protein n=1 Tax=Mixia osmundae (strain CBS 9802 / IAM 14324 / JCM 22182 / KY 12970) TaxID=764103 RepID=G7E930_MIXOS|nr:uncharacterized protein L969DRAFT_86922 [Mixia osmundae IAM 14324]KEI40284.1 hypothetical protein L969DRAFT_86922 [Mixia osmundae IAM 14324]GAA99648.1 hypothetical protein E5Q_06351 [Mixia osmundae IAM 14324]